MQSVPTVADLRSRRLELLQATLREKLLAGDSDDVRVVVEALSGEFDVMQIAAAAVKMAMQADGRGEEKDLPVIDMKPRGHRADERGPRAGGERGTRAGGERGSRASGERGRDGGPAKKKAPRAPSDRPMVRLFVGAGRAAGVRPGDLVGAITGETGHDSQVVGSIEINDRFSIVEVPRDLEDEIAGALRGTKLRGRKVKVDRDRGSR